MPLPRFLLLFFIPFSQINIETALSDYFEGNRRKPVKKGKKTFKLKRAQLRHLETLKEIAASREQQSDNDNEPKPGTSSETTKN